MDKTFYLLSIIILFLSLTNCNSSDMEMPHISNAERNTTDSTDSSEGNITTPTNSPSSLIVEEPPTITPTIFALQAESSDCLSKSWATKKILFEADWDGDREIYSIFPDTKELLQLTNNTVEDGGAIWSPDGESFVFTKGNIANNQSQLYLYDLESKNETLLIPSDIFVYYPYSWSPNGTTLAFDGNDSTYLIDLESLTLEKLDKQDFFAIRNPIWSNDGRYVSYLGSIDVNSLRWQIGLFDPVENDSNKLSIDLFSIDSLAWHPQLSFMIYTGFPSSSSQYQSQIYTVDIDKITSNQLTKSDGLKSNLSISNDGKQLAYVNSLWAFNEELGQSQPQTYRVEVVTLSNSNESTEPQIIFESKSPLGGIDWSIDGSHIVFVESTPQSGAKLYLVELCTNAISFILQDIIPYQFPVWQP